MKKQITRISLALVGVGMFVASAWATDYSTMTTEELSKIRGTLQAATEQERQDFRQEWQNRVGEMTSEERQQYMGSGNKKGQGKGSGYGQGMGKGKGKGGGGGQMNNQN